MGTTLLSDLCKARAIDPSRWTDHYPLLKCSAYHACLGGIGPKAGAGRRPTWWSFVDVSHYPNTIKRLYITLVWGQGWVDPGFVVRQVYSCEADVIE